VHNTRTEGFEDRMKYLATVRTHSRKEVVGVLTAVAL
jgi:hypothetical protein